MEASLVRVFWRAWLSASKCLPYYYGSGQLYNKKTCRDGNLSCFDIWMDHIETVTTCAFMWRDNTSSLEFERNLYGVCTLHQPSQRQSIRVCWASRRSRRQFNLRQTKPSPSHIHTQPALHGSCTKANLTLSEIIALLDMFR